MKNKKWITLVILLSMFLNMPSVVWAYQPAYQLPALTGNQAQDIVNIAQSQVGYSEASDGGTVYGSWWTDVTNWGYDYTYSSWCSMFACWCAEKAGAGLGVIYDKNGAMPSSLFEFLKKNSKYDTSFQTNPQMGDFIFFANTSGRIGHVGIVTGYDESAKKVSFIGGNQGSGEVRTSRCTWAKNSTWGSQTVYGYARPNYVDNSVKNIFQDVNKTDWFADAVQFVYDNGIMSGDSGNFNPNGDMTRAMMVTTLYRLEEEPEVTDYTASTLFGDVEANSWYEDAVNWAYEEEITTGYLNLEPKMFGSHDNVTREQLAVFLYRYTLEEDLKATQREDITDYRGYGQISEYAKEAMSWAVAIELITGVEYTENGQIVYDLEPLGNATRAQLATILMRYCEYYDILD